MSLSNPTAPPTVGTCSDVPTCHSPSYVKVTLARKGLLRQNERFFAPIVYLTRQKDLSFLSEGRRRALLQSQPLPPPQEAPDSWQGRADERNVRKGLFGTKKINYKIAVLLPTPHIYGSEWTLQRTGSRSLTRFFSADEFADRTLALPVCLTLIRIGNVAVLHQGLIKR